MNLFPGTTMSMSSGHGQGGRRHGGQTHRGHGHGGHGYGGHGEPEIFGQFHIFGTFNKDHLADLSRLLGLVTGKCKTCKLKVGQILEFLKFDLFKLDKVHKSISEAKFLGFHRIMFQAGDWWDFGAEKMLILSVYRWMISGCLA